MATEKRYRTVKLRVEVVDLLHEVLAKISRHGTDAFRDARTRERAALLGRAPGPSDVIQLAVEMLRDSSPKLRGER